MNEFEFSDEGSVISRGGSACQNREDAFKVSLLGDLEAGPEQLQGRGGPRAADQGEVAELDGSVGVVGEDGCEDGRRKGRGAGWVGGGIGL
ncbi:hypothetical protein BC938DRAFT_474721 [Jimgerdemannia flammicorona]|uniref:Uncharacterized protein n=1 Tax=Jimgerdemannia flammicorona TaxID=994334 RepID=A0A433QZF3_9FUNG|nr:hypothetical protein BC938DRAFT_474721 [Jimgerdemannia flammicorona]